jgi:hypothetical protein
MDKVSGMFHQIKVHTYNTQWKQLLLIPLQSRAHTAGIFTCANTSCVNDVVLLIVCYVRKNCFMVQSYHKHPIAMTENEQ